MKTEVTDAVVLDYMKHPALPNKKELRITDKCHHFLGKISEGRVYVYCGRCKMFVLVCISINN